MGEYDLLDLSESIQMLYAAVEITVGWLPGNPDEAQLPELVQSIIARFNSEQTRSFSGYLRQLGEMLYQVVGAIDGGDSSSKSAEMTLGSDTDPEVAAALVLSMQHGFANRTILYRDRFQLQASITSLTSAFEAYATDALFTIYSLRPQIISSNTSVPFDKIYTANSMASIVSDVCRSRAVDMIRGPVEEWIAHLTTHCGIKLPSQVSQWDDCWRSLCKNSAIRNSIVHTGGRVDETYKKKMTKYGYTPEHGSDHGRLSIGIEQVLETSRAIAEASTRIIVGLTQHQIKDDKHHESLGTIREIIALQKWRFLENDQISLAVALLSGDGTPSTSDPVTRGDLATWAVLIYIGQESEARQQVNSRKWPDGPLWQLHRAVFLNDRADVETAISNGLKADVFRRVDLWYQPQFFLLRKRMNDLLPEILS
jgi:hypothetical protein